MAPPQPYPTSALIGGRFRREVQRSSGGEGVWWQGVDVTTGDAVAILEVAPLRAAAATDSAVRAAVVTDARLPRVLDVFHPSGQDGAGYIVTTPANGRTLAQRIADGPLSVHEARRIVGEVSQALAAADHVGVHHGDLSPDDVRISDDGSVTVTGVGVAADVAGIPERRAADADLRSLFGLLYASLTGYWPSGGAGSSLPAAPMVHGVPVPPAEIATSVPDDLNRICVDGLADHSTGSTSAADLAARLTGGATEPPTDQRQPGPSWLATPAHGVPLADDQVPPEPEPEDDYRPLLSSDEDLTAQKDSSWAEEDQDQAQDGWEAAEDWADPAQPAEWAPADDRYPAEQDPFDGGAQFEDDRRFNDEEQWQDEHLDDDGRAGGRGRMAGLLAGAAGGGFLARLLGRRSDDDYHHDDDYLPEDEPPDAYVTDAPDGDEDHRPDDPGVTDDAPWTGDDRPAEEAEWAQPESAFSADSAWSAGTEPAQEPAEQPELTEEAEPPVVEDDRELAAAGATVVPDHQTPAQRAAAKMASAASAAAGSTVAVKAGHQFREASESAQRMMDRLHPEIPHLSEEEKRSRTKAVFGIFGAGMALALILSLISILTLFHNTGRIADSLQPSSTTTSAKPQVKQANVPVVLAASAEDPFGDKQENDDQGANVIDKKPATAWRSSVYKTQDFGGLKKGVGLMLTMRAAAPVTSVTITQPGDGGTVEIRNAPQGSYEGSVFVARADLNSPSTTITLPGKPVAKNILVWFTALPNTSGQYMLKISEISVK